MRTWVVALLALAACDLVTGPDVRHVNRRPLSPVPPTYSAWYAEVEACLGRRGDFGAVHWFVADSMIVDGALVDGLWESPDDITLHPTVRGAERIVKHEMVHHVLQAGLSIHDGHGRVPCAQ